MNPTAEEVIRQREEKRKRQSAFEAPIRAREEAHRARQKAIAESNRRIELVNAVRAQIPITIQRLKEHGWPGGHLEEVVTGYEPRPRWWGGVATVAVTAELAVWRLSSGRSLASNGKLYEHRLLHGSELPKEFSLFGNESIRIYDLEQILHDLTYLAKHGPVGDHW